MRDHWNEKEERREPLEGDSRRLLVLGAVAAVAFLAGTHFFGKQKEEPALTPALERTGCAGADAGRGSA